MPFEALFTTNGLMWERMMRVLMVNKFLYPNGGSETYIFKLGEAPAGR